MYFIRGRFVNFRTRRNKSLHTQGHHSFAGKNGLLYCHLFSSISLSVCLKLTVWNDVDVLARSLSAVLIAVAFRHLATKPSYYFACYIFILLFSRAVAIAISPLLFSLLGLPCRSSLLSAIFILAAIFCHAIFIAAIHFIAVQPAILWLFIQGWTLSCCFCSAPVVAVFILLLKMFSLRLQVTATFFFCCISGCRFSHHFHAVMPFLLSLFN